MKTSKLILILALAFVASMSSSAQIGMIAKKIHNATATSGLTQEDAAAGIREALQKGIDTAVKLVARPDGYFGNNQIKIPFPEEVKSVETKLRSLGMGNLADEVILTMNRAAEDAAKEAIPIFTSAISKMTVNDAISIVNGPADAATRYLQQSSSGALNNAFRPVIQQSLDRVNATAAWQTAIGAYNRICYRQGHSGSLCHGSTGREKNP